MISRFRETSPTQKHASHHWCRGTFKGNFPSNTLKGLIPVVAWKWWFLLKRHPSLSDAYLWRQGRSFSVFWFPIPPTTGPFRIDSCYTSMINGGSQQSLHFSAFTNDETHWTTPPSTCWMAILSEKTTSKTKCEAGFLVYSSAAILSQTATEITNAKSSSVFLSFLASPNLLYRSGVFLCCSSIFLFSFLNHNNNTTTTNNKRQNPTTSILRAPLKIHITGAMLVIPMGNGVFFTNEMPEMERQQM